MAFLTKWLLGQGAVPLWHCRTCCSLRIVVTSGLSNNIICSTVHLAAQRQIESGTRVSAKPLGVFVAIATSTWCMLRNKASYISYSGCLRDVYGRRYSRLRLFIFIRRWKLSCHFCGYTTFLPSKSCLWPRPFQFTYIFCINSLSQSRCRLTAIMM